MADPRLDGDGGWATADQVVVELNGRPRVVLDGATPAELLQALIAHTT